MSYFVVEARLAGDGRESEKEKLVSLKNKSIDFSIYTVKSKNHSSNCFCFAKRDEPRGDKTKMKNDLEGFGNHFKLNCIYSTFETLGKRGEIFVEIIDDNQ